MPEAIFKLQPDRTMHLRGFDHLGAAAALHSATPTGFDVSGVFRDPADFAVLVLWDADNFFDHPRVKYLPDFRFDGLVLDCDVEYEGLMPLSCRKYPTIDWPYLDAVRPDGSTSRIRLADPEIAAVADTPDMPAQGEFTISANGHDWYDRLTIWYQNMAFDYIVPGQVRCEFTYQPGAVGTAHQVTVGGRSYSTSQVEGDTAAAIAQRLAAASSDDPEAYATVSGPVLQLAAKLDTAATFSVSASTGESFTLHHIQATTVCRAIRDQVNGANYTEAQTPFALQAESIGDTLRIRTVEGGYDANFITLYAVAKNPRLTTTGPTTALSGGTSTAKLHLRLDFAALGLSSVRAMWLTFAPRLANAAPYQAGEWHARFSNWSVTGPDEVRRLRVATPLSVRVASDDPRCRFTGDWGAEEGFYAGQRARVATRTGAVSIRYACEAPHELWIGTSLYSDRGSVTVEIDGVAAGALDARLSASSAVVTRRPIAIALPAGEHTVVLTSTGAGPFYFDFLEAVVPGDVPDPMEPRGDLTAALDYSTDHTYKLPPARILWNLENLGLSGPMNEYLGVFWWNQRRQSGAALPSCALTFGGEFVDGDAVYLDVGGQHCGKSVFPNESPTTVAAHFRHLINATYVGVWAESSGPVLTIRARSAAPAYAFPVAAQVQRMAGSTASVTAEGALSGGTMGVWEVDPSAANPLNAGARAWHSDFYRCCAAKGLSVTTACSMELVNPPAPFAAKYPNGEPVLTDVGFGGLRSTHCAFRPEVFSYQASVYQQLAGLMASAGLTPDLQFGEFTWWYFAKDGGMAYYDEATAADAIAALGHPLHIFGHPDDDPLSHSPDASFLRNRLRDYVASLVLAIRSTYPDARLELLYPYDVNHLQPAGIHGLGGKLNHFVNLPSEWEHKDSAPFDRIKVEALDFGAWSRDLDLAQAALRFPLDLGWPGSSVRAMIPVFRGGYPWEKDVEFARGIGLEAASLWAFDHVCLYGWRTEDRGWRRASRQG